VLGARLRLVLEPRGGPPRALFAGKYNTVNPFREDLRDPWFVAVEHVGCLWNRRGADLARAPLQLL
jgi:hypothetical protein